ncbi:hypothetical protein [Bradyrhizobium monzae]|uniref:hypothetical protein n=1 Tax=Bradyrhizobium sp. Oc8 TaxID=2876780 RepID=UPI001F2A1EE4|nr:hypothetical protein [Bradyrhizobium sp. Oc8]
MTELRVEGISQDEFVSLCGQVGLSHQALQMTTPKNATGNVVLDVLLPLKDVDLNAFSLLGGIPAWSGHWPLRIGRRSLAQIA